MVMYWSVDKNMTWGLQELKPVFLLGASGSVFANLVFVAAL